MYKLLTVIALATIAWNSGGKERDQELRIQTGLQDAPQLRDAARWQHVPAPLVYGIAWMETRDGRKGNSQLGPGVLHKIRKSPSTCRLWDGATKPWLPPVCAEFTEVRVCREIGRMQLSPCVNWTQVLQDDRCSLKRITESYQDNIHCGIKYMRLLHDRYGWEKVPVHYNGGSIYQASVEHYNWRLTLRMTSD
jgi:hypothetical protein